jgi:gliding motility-associated-like protein
MKQTLFLFLLFSCHFVFSQVNLNLGLVAYYPFNGNANDQSGNNNNPIFNNATLTADRFGNPNSAYYFNGVDNYMRIPNSPSINPVGQISICAWVKVMGFYQGQCHGNNIVMKGDADYLTGNYMIRYDDYAYTNGQNCSNPVPDINHENFYGIQTIIPAGGYIPFIQTSQWYSVVYTCDGNTAKIYVNCELKASGPANGITFSNGYDLFLGRMNHPQFPYWFNGVMNEVRIYNRALNIDEVKTYGACLLTNATNVSGVINNYTPVLSFNPCNNKINVEDASAFNANDTVLLIQMKGAIIDSSNTSNFGTITDYKNSGNYEFNFVKSKSGNVIELKNKLTRQYDIPDGKVQLVRVPYFQNANITSTLSCLPWDGSKGGVLVLNVKDTINLASNIDVSGNGFKGAQGYIPGNTTLDCFQNDYNYPISANIHAGQKGESIAIISQNIICGKGSPACGGGGGLGHNSGGGGGANGGAGGLGGYQLDACGNAPFDNRGIGGHQLAYNSFTNKVFMGGGGGAGQADNAGNLPPTGGNGGGIIIILSNFLESNSNKIVTNGNNGVACSIPPSVDCHDGMGGAGAGGTVLLNINNQILDNAMIENKGGKGADMIGSVPLGGRIGAGGGGSGGLLFLKNNSLPANITNINNGGLNGVLTTDGNNPWGATPGQNGITLFNLLIPFDTVLFKPNIDSVRINDSTTGCKSFDFKGLAYTNTSPVSAWQWYFGDGGTANTQNISHTYPSVNTFTVKLIATDVNSCKDSITKNVTTHLVTASAGGDTSFCSNTPVTLTLNGSSNGGTIYAWRPPSFLNDSTLQHPIATIGSTTKFYLTVNNGMNCSATDSVIIALNSIPQVKASKSNDIDCSNGSSRLNATGALQYQWSPTAGLSNSNIVNPIATPTVQTQYTVKGTDANGCMNNDTVTIKITGSGKSSYLMPSAFTPNGDGLNDCYGIKYWGVIQKLDFSIYNRWGERIFYTKNPGDCWDGTYKGVKQNPDVYVYIITAKTGCGNVFRKGTFLLIR